MTYPLTADGGPDDLPRTLRREKEAREREAREREAAERALAQRETLPMGPSPAPAARLAPEPASHVDESMYETPDPHYSGIDEPSIPATVQRFDVPFLHLVSFFLKAAVAAVPAMLLLGVFAWIAGHMLKTFFPWLVKAQILIHFPN